MVKDNSDSEAGNPLPLTVVSYRQPACVTLFVTHPSPCVSFVFPSHFMFKYSLLETLYFLAAWITAGDGEMVSSCTYWPLCPLPIIEQV